MHAYIFFGEKVLLDEEIAKFLKEEKYSEINVRHFQIKKVEDVRDLIRETNFRFKERTVYIIEDFDQASVVAQNAFLKRLEEPQKNLTFLLTATKEVKVLETILSRCIVKKIASKNLEEEVESLWGKDINSQFALVDKIKTREEAKVLLESMLKSKDKDLKKTKFVLNTLERIEKNANVTLQLSALIVKVNN